MTEVEGPLLPGERFSSLLMLAAWRTIAGFWRGSELKVSRNMAQAFKGSPREARKGGQTAAGQRIASRSPSRPGIPLKLSKIAAFAQAGPVRTIAHMGQAPARRKRGHDRTHLPRGRFQTRRSTRKVNQSRAV